MKKLLLSIGLIFLITFLICYFFLGLNSYINVVIRLEQITNDKKAESKANFYTIDTTNQYSGILGYWTDKDKSFILIWGKLGPKIYLTDDKTVYSQFKFCSEDVLNLANQTDASVHIGRTLTQNVTEWAPYVRSGSYVAITHRKTEGNILMKTASEIKTTDIWAFLPVNIFEECRKLK